MKKIIIMLFVLLVMGYACNVWAEEEYAAQMTLKVLDDLGEPVPRAEVVISTFEKWIPGQGFGKTEYKRETGVCDTNGLVTLELSGQTGRYKCMAHPPKGYYWNNSVEYAFKDAVNGRWQPWNPLVELTLKRVVNPIPMYAQHFNPSGKEPIPAEGYPIGFDLMKGDWISPYGNGKNPDIFFELIRQPERRVKWGYRQKEVVLFDVSLNISFPNDGDGIQSVYAHPLQGSKLLLPREAPIGGYKGALTKRMYQDSPENINMDSREDQNYFFRVRTEKDADGNIVSALYGKIRGDFEGYEHGSLRFTYYLNPTPNDRNMEFDPAQNLLPGGQVDEP